MEKIPGNKRAWDRLKRRDRERGFLAFDNTTELRKEIEQNNIGRTILAPFNDWIQEKAAPTDPNAKKHLVLRDVRIQGKNCDIYHWDQNADGSSVENRTFHRIYIHIKE